MEFKSLKNIETSFRQIRLFGIVYTAACALVVVCSVVVWVWPQPVIMPASIIAQSSRARIFFIRNSILSFWSVDADLFIVSGIFPPVDFLFLRVKLKLMRVDFDAAPASPGRRML